METRRVEQGDTLYENVLTVGEADHVVAVFLLLLHRGSHIGLVFQIERIPEVALGRNTTSHFLELFPLHVANLAAFYSSPPFSVSVDGAFTCDRYVLALAGCDGCCGSQFFGTCSLVNLDQVVLILGEHDDGVLLEVQVDVVLE